MGLDGDTDTLSAVAIADADPDALLGWFQGPPAVHRYPCSMPPAPRHCAGCWSSGTTAGPTPRR
ncbi:MAG TPA: hypothetical protein VJ352_00450, partial [Geodermatophilus sp.]|nr:hypothetical protein [Geodermatophilus sp.]